MTALRRHPVKSRGLLPARTYSAEWRFLGGRGGAPVLKAADGIGAARAEARGASVSTQPCHNRTL